MILANEAKDKKCGLTQRVRAALTHGPGLSVKSLADKLIMNFNARRNTIRYHSRIAANTCR